MQGAWDSETFKSRIADTTAQTRHAGGSPNALEIRTYASVLPNDTSGDTAVVLGMTPELRALAADRFKSTIAVEVNHCAIDLYREWLTPRQLGREQIIQADWLDLHSLIPNPVAVVLGDGVCGNLPDKSAHRCLLQVIASVLRPGGRFITRHAVYPDNYAFEKNRAETLVQEFRAGQLSEAEFGFAMRLVGHHDSAFDSETHTLDNATLFQHCELAHARGELTDHEHAIIRRYYFGGNNCILRESHWKKLLNEAGFTGRALRLTGQHWYDYYVIYDCRCRVA